jgi:hypothetical protein
MKPVIPDYEWITYGVRVIGVQFLSGVVVGVGHSSALQLNNIVSRINVIHFSTV